MFHLGDSFEGLKRPKQNPGADSWLFAGNVQQIGHSIVEVDICVSMSQKERPVSSSRPSISMTAGITWRIGLRFNNPSAQADIPKIADKSFADQKSRELDGAGGQLCPARWEGRCAFSAMIMEANVSSHVVFNVLPIQRSKRARVMARVRVHGRRQHEAKVFQPLLCAGRPGAFAGYHLPTCAPPSTCSTSPVT